MQPLPPQKKDGSPPKLPTRELPRAVAQKPVVKQNPWGSQNPDFPDEVILQMGLGEQCAKCKCTVLNNYLTHIKDKPLCPDCYDIVKKLIEQKQAK